MDYTQFDEMVDIETIIVEMEEAAEANPAEYVDVPPGTYEVKVTKFELGESSTGNKMIKGRFRVIAGDFKGQTIFYNQVVKQGFQFHEANKFMQSLAPEVDVKLDTSDPMKVYSRYAATINAVYQAVRGKKEFALEYGQNSKGFSTFKIINTFPVKRP